jgi:DNA-binding NtrC family response regulator
VHRLLENIMSNSLVFYNCSAATIDRIRSALAEPISTQICHSWTDLCEVMQGDRDLMVVAERADCDSDEEAEGTLTSMYSLTLQRRQVGPLDGNGSAGRPASAPDPSGTLADQIDACEHRIIVETLRRNRNHRKETAAVLGISRVTLYNKMKKFGMLS